MKSDVAAFAKILSVVRVFFDGELFEAIRSEFVSESDKRQLPIKVFTDLRFGERVGGGYFALQKAYRNEAIKALDSQTIETVHYIAYQFHMSKLNSTTDYLNYPLHLYEALYHAKATLDIDGFF